MNRNDIKYQPYRVETYILLIELVVMEIISFVIFGAVLHEGDIQELFGWGIMAISCGFLAKWCYDLTKIVVFFEEDGLRLINCGYKKHCYFPWQNLSYGYYCRDYKGNLYLVLAPESLNRKQLKQKVNRSMLSLKMNIDNIIVIDINGDKEIFQIKAMISEKIPYIKDEGREGRCDYSDSKGNRNSGK